MCIKLCVLISMKQYWRIFTLLGLFSALLSFGCGTSPTDEVPATETPQNFMASSLNFSQRVTLTWTEEENVTYTLFRSTNSNFVTSDETKISDNVTSPHDDENLTNGTTYYYRLTATKESFGMSAPTEAVSATPLLETPQNFTARAFNQRVTLTWTEEENVTYTLFRSTDSNFSIGYETRISDDVTSPYEDRNLTNGQTYYYRLTSVDFLGASESTDELSATPLLRAPQNFTARAFNQRVTLTWAAEEGVTYTLFRSTLQGFGVNDRNRNTVRKFSNRATSVYQDRRLTNDTTYYYRLVANGVSATNEPIASEPTDAVSATPSLRTPQNFTATAFHQRVTLTWTVEEAIIRDVPVTYTLFLSTTPNFMTSDGTEISGVTPPHTLTMLTNNTTFYFRLTANSVSAMNEPIASEPSDEVSATPTLTPQNFTAKAFDRRVTLTWAADEAVTYTLFRSTDSNFVTSNETEISDNATSPYDDQNLTNGQAYYYRLRASFSGDTSEPTDEVSATPLLRTPQNFTAEAFSGQVTLSWAKEEGVTYSLFHSTREGFALESGIEISGVTPPHALTMLTNNTKYYFRLAANSLSAMNEPIASAPTDEVSATPQTQISAGGRHTCAVVEGRALCWGRGKEGQLGDHTAIHRTPMDRHTPVQVHGLTSGVTQISAGDTHTCAVVDGRALCWGRGHFGELGHRDETNDMTAVRQAKDRLRIVYGEGENRSRVTKNITLPTTGANGVSISWESSDTDTITTTGTVTRPANKNTVVTLTATLTKNAVMDTKNFNLTVIILDAGAITQAIANLAIGYSGTDNATGVTAHIRLPQAGANGVGITWAETTDSNNSIAIRTDTKGNLWGWITRPSSMDTMVTLTATLTKNAAMGTKAFMLTVLTEPNTDTIAVARAKNRLEIIYRSGDSDTSVKGNLRLFRTGSDGVRISWASTPAGLVSNSGAVTRPSNMDTMVTLTATLTKNDASDTKEFTLTVIKAGGIRVRERYVTEANPQRVGKTIPTQVYGLTSGVTQISAGDFHTCALVNGGAWCWGSSFFGQLGNGQIAGHAQSDPLTPQQVMGLTSGVTQISAGRKHTCAVVEGAAFCWGKGVSGQLGNNSDSNASTPRQVIGLTSGVTQISAGDSHTCALVNGAAWCWGEGVFAQLGNSANQHALIPKQVTGLTSGVTQISAGGRHTCAVVNERVQCWGEGGNGRLGHNDRGNKEADKSRPTRVMGLRSGVTQISAGDFHTCALVNDSIQCWGEGDNGQLGLSSGSDGPALTPDAVSGL